MVSARVFLKTGAVAAVVVGASGPLAASDPHAILVLGAPATENELYIGKKFNFTPADFSAETLLTDDRFNYVRERDRMSVQAAK